MPPCRSPPLAWLPLLPLSSSLAQAASARLPAISSAAVFIIRAPRKTIPSLEGRAVPLGRAPRDFGGLHRHHVRPAAGPRDGTSTVTLAAPGGGPNPSTPDR